MTVESLISYILSGVGGICFGVILILCFIKYKMKGYK